MGTLGQYLRDAREKRGIDLRDAAQQTRISLNYLKALEEENFTRLPGEVFVKGFLKNYGKFLHLDESEVLKKFGELKPQQAVPGAPVEKKQEATVNEENRSRKIPVEPFVWGAGIVIVLMLFLFIELPVRRVLDEHNAVTPSPAGYLDPAPVPSQNADKLYLEVVALENTWLLVRTDASPQKQAVLKKGESLIWSADERFLLSYGAAGAIKLLLNGQELIVNELKNAAVRDLAVTATGIVSRKSPQELAKPARPKRQPVSMPSITSVVVPQPVVAPQPQENPVPENPIPEKPAPMPAQAMPSESAPPVPGQ